MDVAFHELSQTEERITVPSGLKGVLAVSTGIGDVRGREGFYHYRQYSAIDLAEKCSFEEVWHLLFEGALPNARELAGFREKLLKHRVVAERVNALLNRITASGVHADPLGFLRSAISIIGGDMGLKPSLDLPIEKLKEEAVSIASIVPLVLARYHRWSTGQSLIDADPTASFAANYLHLVTGRTPSPEAVRGLDKYLIATIDHGLNSSTFTARVIASTGADIAACVVGAIGALSGPLHGGAPSRALDTLDEMRAVPDAEAWVRERIAAGDKLMGFGHAVYRTEDPRSRMLRKACAEIGGEQYEYAVQAETLILRLLAEMKPGRELHTNVEFYAGVLMDLCGLPREMFTPTFACSRVVGWVSHVLEQVANNKIIRPSSLYIGNPPPMPVPSLEKR